MKNLYEIITILLFCNFISSIAGVECTQGNTTEIKNITTPYQTPQYNTAISYLSEKWQLRNLQPFVYDCIFDHYVARAYSDMYQQDVVLKINESNDECKALQYLQCDAIVKLLDYNYEYCAILLSYIPSQGCLADYIFAGNDENEIINIFVDLFIKIHTNSQPLINHDFNMLQDYFAVLHSDKLTKIPKNLIQKALQLHDELFISNKSLYLLHGDLHCYNILQCENNFIVIDPWASVGPLEYEIASFLANPTDFLLSQNNTQDILQNRLNKFSNLLHCNKQRLKDWSFMRMILLASICEMQNKNDDWINNYIQAAEIIEQLDTDK